MDQRIEAMLPNGEWVELERWSSEGAEYDAAGWLERWRYSVGSSIAALPLGGAANMAAFIAIRGGVVEA